MKTQIFTIDGIDFTLDEIKKALADLDRKIQINREMILQDHWTKNAAIGIVKTSQARIEFLTNMLKLRGVKL